SSTVGQGIGSETIKGLGTGSVQQVLNYGYDDDEYLTSVGSMTLAYNVPNGQLTGTTLGAITDSYTYNSYGEIETYQARYGSTVVYSYTLTRDAIGRVSTKTETLNSVTTVYGYTYDEAGRLTEVTTNSVLTSTYVYDDNSNRVGGLIRGEATTATYDDQDRLTNYNGDALTYNANGELLTKGSIATSYDVFGNLKSWNNGTSAITYEIDPAQRRLGKIVNGTLNQRYMYNPEGQLIGELNSTNQLVKTFVYGSKRHVPDYYINSTNNKFRIITDHLGSVRLVISETIMVSTPENPNPPIGPMIVSKIMEHDEFGRVLQDTNPGLIPFGFAGGVYDSGTGLVQFGARGYDPQVGRWLSKDPIGFDGGDVNLYGYTFNDPINGIDPTGLDTWGTGFSLNLSGFGYSYYFSMGFVKDGKGQRGAYVSSGFGAGDALPSASITSDTTKTNACDINQLGGGGYHASGAVTVGRGLGVAVGGGFNGGNGFTGQTGSIGVGTPGFGFSTAPTGTKIFGF
ncbi:MAG: hypothetical protein K2Q18_06010, partial [Bdellovibrionales bacterium]|nr:hypothetical protein [Bdellovibrionales bacterium]